MFDDDHRPTHVHDGEPRTTRPSRDDPSPADLARHLVRLGRRCSRLQYEICRLLARYDLTGHWAASGAVTCSTWAAEALGVESSTAREWLRVGHALARLDRVDRAFAHGELSYSQVRTLTRVAIDHPDRQDELVELASASTAPSLAAELATWTAEEEDPVERDRRHRRDAALTSRVQPDGTVVVTARLAPLDGARVLAAVDARLRAGRRPRTAGEDRPTLARLRSEALVDLVCPPVDDAGQARTGAAVATEIVLHVRGDGCTLDDGTPISGHVVERIAPASFLRALIHDADSRPIDASGRHRHPTTRQQRVVAERDRHTCTVQGCSARRFLELHHDPPYDQSRRTVIDELCLRCSAHHRRGHRDP